MFPVKKLLLLGFCCFSLIVSLAQSGQDTVTRPPQRDTVTIKKDSLSTIAPGADSLANIAAPSTADSTKTATPPVAQPKQDNGIPVASVVQTPVMALPRPTLGGFQKALRNHPYFNFFGRGVLVTSQLKKESHDEALFYFLVTLLFYFGMVRLLFNKYLDNMKSLFFRVTMRQQQIRDQLLQSPLPSLFLNILFVISGGLYLSFVVNYYNIVPGMNRWF